MTQSKADRRKAGRVEVHEKKSRPALKLEVLNAALAMLDAYEFEPYPVEASSPYGRLLRATIELRGRK